MAVVCPSCGTENPDSAKFCSECAAPIALKARSRESRRTVTILFADVSGSTSLGEQLDPESLRALMSRYFAEMRTIIERHGGTVEKFIGDAVMAVFGIPDLHEDDALRAVRAAADIRDSLAELNKELEQSRGLAIVFRTGVNTGQVVAGDPSSGQTLVTGDTVNTAARLEQAAPPGQILLGRATYRLVRDAVVAEPVEPIQAKGKAEPVPAYRLVSVIAGAAGLSRRLDAPMVGRGRELRLLTDAFERSVADRAGQLVTMLGAAGVGKSRLVAEFRSQIGERATFLAGRCLSYGEGITYWPLADALRPVVAVDDSQPAESWRAGLTRLVAGQAQAEAIVEQVTGLLGVGEAAGGTEGFWAVRRLLESMARQLPLVLVIDDLQWATPTFLDLVEHVADWTRDAPILLVGLARPDLLDGRPGWGGGKMNATTFLLEPLDASSIDSVLAHLVGSEIADGLGRRIAAAAEGNPLFVEELVAMLIEGGALVPEADGMRLTAEPAELEVPPSIEALMSARLAQLPAGDRAALERGSVIGIQFGAGELARLSDESERATVRSALMAMVRRDLLRPDTEAQLPLGADDEAFRFRHQLIHDGAYAGMSKAERARLHARYAAMLEELPAEQLGLLDEVVGYHLEQAHLLWESLGGQPASLDVAARAAAHLGAAGKRALDRWDGAAAANMLSRALRLLPPTAAQRIPLLPQLAYALSGRGRFDEAEAALSEAIAATDDGSQPAARVEALLTRTGLALQRGARGIDQDADVEEALAIAEATGDPRPLAMARLTLAYRASFYGRTEEARREAQLAIEAAQRAGDLALEADARISVGFDTWMATGTASDIDRIHAENLAFARKHNLLGIQAGVLRAQSAEAGRRGLHDEARRLMTECLAIVDELGLPLLRAGMSTERGLVEYLAGDALARERVLREGFDQLREMGERGVLSTIAADLADALIDLGRVDEAQAVCTVAEDAGADDDMATQVRVRLVRARLAAQRGRMTEALSLAADAMALADQGEVYDLRTGSRLVLAELLLDMGRLDEARTRAEELLDLARVRGDVVFEARARELLERTSAAWSDSH
ncbi:MAG: adenylate/guanylate cyclase domain-containing protein [Chloroflexota bacterium]